MVDLAEDFTKLAFVAEIKQGLSCQVPVVVSFSMCEVKAGILENKELLGLSFTTGDNSWWNYYH